MKGRMEVRRFLILGWLFCRALRFCVNVILETKTIECWFKPDCWNSLKIDETVGPVHCKQTCRHWDQLEVHSLAMLEVTEIDSQDNRNRVSFLNISIFYLPLLHLETAIPAVLVSLILIQ
jgi:hypothetical protein